MSNSATLNGLQFLRPYLHNAASSPIKHRSLYLRLFSTTRPRRSSKRALLFTEQAQQAASNVDKERTVFGGYEDRVATLKAAHALEWPRMQNVPEEMTIAEFIQKYNHLPRGSKSQASVVIRGRVKVSRAAGKKLAFFDLVQDFYQVQVVCNASTLETFGGSNLKAFKTFLRLSQRGDIFSVTGRPYVTETGELSIEALEIPTLLAPALLITPTNLEDPATRVRNRHVDMIVNREVADRIRVRSHIIQHLREFLLKDNFLEVQTPLIADKASGAIAKSFKTEATEFADKELALRIAPELWLKRLIIGGMDRVFEIGPSFRNEGLDATHNPEFTTCEFYKAFADLKTLMSMTENLFTGLAEKVKTLQAFPLKTLPKFDESLVSAPFPQIQFIPALQEALGDILPNLAADDATENVIELFNKHSIPLPAKPTLPRLLDRLATIYIEPQCTNATFITHHPACMGPLAKSFLDYRTNQIVSARAELFIQNSEIANMYEEENSPLEQRAKFVQQARFVDDENEGYVDESYILALESGLPPTGGWGAGVDRMVMLFSGAKRIGDVLSFGTMRNVVYLGNNVAVQDGKGEEMEGGAEKQHGEVDGEGEKK